MFKYSRAIGSLKPEGAFIVLAKAKALEAEGHPMIHLEIGEPDFDTPAHISEAAKVALDEGWTHYTPSLGIMELREAIAADLSARRGVAWGADEVIVCPGAKPALMATVLALVEPGGKVLYPDPGFPSYHSLVAFVGAEGVGIPLLEENGFAFDLEFLERELPGADLLIVNSPQNPTGGVLDSPTLARIAELCVHNNVPVLSDEVYSRLVYGAEHTTLASLPGMRERTVVVDGFSKTYAMTGWRAGYAAAPRELIDRLGLFMNNSTSCVNAMTQRACIAAVLGSQEPTALMVANFSRRRDLIVNGLNAIDNVTCQTPGGAFYVFPNITATGVSGQEISDHMLTKGVALSPGVDFGPHGEGYIRLSYANSQDNITKALEILGHELGAISR